MRPASIVLALASCFLLCLPPASADPGARLTVELAGQLRAQPLDTLTASSARGGTLVVSDGEGRVYARLPATGRVSFQVGGSLGTHTVRRLLGGQRVVEQTEFTVDAQTTLEEDTGRFQTLFRQALDTMLVRLPSRDPGAPPGGHDPRSWRGRSYQLYVVWALDQAQTSKGMAYVSPFIRDGVALFRDAQKSDGMIWSFFQNDDGRRGYWDTVYGPLGYAWHDGGLLFVRQPVDNHSEYEFVNMLYTAWQASGDDAFMTASLDAALRALEYALQDPARFSQRFGLLKRPYSIDSWDFQLEDEYLVLDSLAPTMTIDREQTKFGVFFGDNTGYIHACHELAVMLAHAGRSAEAEQLAQRAQTLAARLREVSWNGQFFRHFLDEDASVVRHLGVDQASQLAQANAYSLNRGIAHEQAVAILRTYQALSARLPEGSPGEWYAIYPPFGRGAGDPDKTWQYMNGGVSGHAASELSRGAYAHGFEAYGSSVLERSAALAQRTDGVIHFAYTGAIPAPPPAPRFTLTDLRQVANMDLASPSSGHAWMDEAAGNDLSRLPAGKLSAGGAPFLIADPARNQRRAVVAVAERPDYAHEVSLSLEPRRAAAVHLLHALHENRLHHPPTDDIAASLTFQYVDGSERGVYLRRGVHVAGWWYPQLSGPDAGVAWRGENQKTGDVGLSFCAIENPEPDKPIAALRLRAAANGRVYALAALTLADRKPYHAPDPVSYGGPDNWSGSNMVAALVEGLAGVLDTDRAYATAQVSPRWPATSVRRARVIARYGASRGYVAYRYEQREAERALDLTLTGSGHAFRARVLLPAATRLEAALLDGEPVLAHETSVESSRYVELDLAAGVHHLRVRYTGDSLR